MKTKKKLCKKIINLGKGKKTRRINVAGKGSPATLTSSPMRATPNAPITPTVRGSPAPTMMGPPPTMMGPPPTMMYPPPTMMYPPPTIFPTMRGQPMPTMMSHGTPFMVTATTPLTAPTGAVGMVHKEPLISRPVVLKDITLSKLPELDKQLIDLPLPTQKDFKVSPKSNVSRLRNELDFLNGMIDYMTQIQTKADNNEYNMLVHVSREEWETQRLTEIELFKQEYPLIIRYIQYIFIELTKRGIILIVSGGAAWNFYSDGKYPIADLDLNVYITRGDEITLDDTRDLIETLTIHYLKMSPEYKDYDFLSVSHFSVKNEIRKNPSMMAVLESIKDTATLSRETKTILKTHRAVLTRQAKLDRLNPSKLSKKINGRFFPLVEFSFTEGPVVPMLNVMFSVCPRTQLRYLSLIELSLKLLNNLKKNDGDIEVRLTGGETNITSRKLQSWKEQAEFLRDLIAEYV